MEAPTVPSSLILEVYHSLLLNIFNWNRPPVIGSIRLGAKKSIQDFGKFWPFLVLWAPRGGPYGPLTPDFGGLP